MSTSALKSQIETTNEFQEKKIANIFANDAVTSKPVDKVDSDSTQPNVNTCFLSSKVNKVALILFQMKTLFQFSLFLDLINHSYVGFSQALNNLNN
jgi:hypothetical protein